MPGPGDCVRGTLVVQPECGLSRSVHTGIGRGDNVTLALGSGEAVGSTLGSTLGPAVGDAVSRTIRTSCGLSPLSITAAVTPPATPAAASAAAVAKTVCLIFIVDSSMVDGQPSSMTDPHNPHRPMIGPCPLPDGRMRTMNELIRLIRDEIDRDEHLANGEDERAHNERHWPDRVLRQVDAFRDLLDLAEADINVGLREPAGRIVHNLSLIYNLAEVTALAQNQS